MCRLTNPVIIQNELRTTCTPELNRLLFDILGAETLKSSTEEQLLQHIKLVVVRRLHKEVHQQKFHLMRQKKGELIMHFLVRLWTLAKFCEFITFLYEPDCGRQINYSSDMVARQMVTGLTNTELQSKISAEVTTFTTLQQKFDRLISLEMTDQLIPHFCNTMHHTTMANMQRSNCKQQCRKVKISLTPQYTKSCRGCAKDSPPIGYIDHKS